MSSDRFLPDWLPLQRRVTILIFLSLAVLTMLGQTNSLKSGILNDSLAKEFSLYYGFSGLGSNMGTFQPTIRIKGTDFLYSYEQNSYFGTKDKRIDTICTKQFRQGSIDSILEITKNVGDTTIREYNFCIMSGGIHFLTVINGTDTTNFELSNTFHYTALKVINILNEYTPSGKQIYANEQMIKDAEDCLRDLLEKTDDNRKKKKSAKNKSGG